MARLPFKSLFCEKFGCSPAEYEEWAFRKCLFWHARLLAPVFRTINPDFFLEDFKFIRYVGESVGVREANLDVLNYNDANRGNPSFLRTGLKLRVSGRKASRLVHQLSRETRQADTTALPQ
jgi:hypothetical protein